MFKDYVKTGLLLLALCLIALGCSDDPEAEDYDEYDVWVDDTADFSSYATFGFADLPEDILEDAPENAISNHDKIVSMVTEQLVDEGLTESEDPDLLVSTLTYADEENGYVYECVPGYYWWGYYWYYDSCAWVDETYVEYGVGTILIPIADVEAETVVFMGALQGILDSSSDGEERIQKGLDWIFSYWPN